MRHELTDDIREAFPDEREALRGLAVATNILIRALKVGDEPITEKAPVLRENPTRKQRREWKDSYTRWEERQKHPSTLGWKNELSVSALLELEGKWLPLAKERLGLTEE